MAVSGMGLGEPGWALGVLGVPSVHSVRPCALPNSTSTSPFQDRLKAGLAHPLWSWTTRVASRGFFWWTMTSWG